MTQKLSPTMQAAMWRELRAETQIAVPGMTDATAHALSRRGFYNLAARKLTETGRAWIAEQIEAAREDALIYNVARVLSHPANLLAATRLAAMSGVYWTGVSSIPAIDVERDAELAWRMHRYAYNIRNAQSAGHHQQEQQIAMDAGFNLGDLARIARTVQPV